MPGTPARSGGGVMLAGSGVLAIATAVAWAGLAVVSTATPALAVTAGQAGGGSSVPLNISPSVAMPALPVTFTVSCGPGVKSATLIGTTVGLPGPVAMKSTRDGTFAVTVSLPTGIRAGVYQAYAACESGDFGTADLTVNAPPPPPPPPTRSPQPPRPTWRPKPPPTAAPITGDGATSDEGGLGGATEAGLGLLGVGSVTGLAAARRFRKRG